MRKLRSILSCYELREFLVSSKKSLKKKIVINFFTMFFGTQILSFEKQKIATQHGWVNDENDEAHVYKFILVFRSTVN